MSDSSFAATSCSIEMYPFEGGPYVIDGGQIRSVTVEKNIRGGSAGTIQIELAPGGPQGPESQVTWAQVATPMSHILVGMSRGDKAAIVMDGVVLRSIEAQEWHTESEGASFAMRSQIIQGEDFSWFFRNFSWYSLSFLGLTAGTALGNAMKFAPAGLPNTLAQGFTGSSDPKTSNPAQVGRLWYEKIMAGEGGILGTTYVPYKSNEQVLFSKAVSTLWENYLDVYIPFPSYYLAAEGTWMAKFQESIFPFPWYEFFVTTAPSGVYTLASGSTGTTASGTLFKMSSQPLAPSAGPQLVARVNPVPSLHAIADTNTHAATFGELDMTRWSTLPVYTPSLSFFHSEIYYDAETAYNFYMLNPLGYAMLGFNVNNGNNIPYFFSQIGAADTASVHRYGYRMMLGTFQWLFDPEGLAAQNGDINMLDTIAAATARLMGWHHPNVLMAKATVVFPLMPDVLVGTKFHYAPYKDGKIWEFYVEGFKHNFVFGGQSSTTLTLTRGLPLSIYQDAQSEGLLRAIYLGNAMRKGGVYTKGLPPGSTPYLTMFGMPESIQTMAGNMAKIFVTPQAGTN